MSFYLFAKFNYSSSDIEDAETKGEVMEVNSESEVLFNEQKKKKKRKHKHHKHKREKVLEKEDGKVDKQDRLVSSLYFALNLLKIYFP